MHRFVLMLMILLAGSTVVGADVGPPRPRPPRPPGPERAVLRGISVLQQYGYWQGYRWMVRVEGCEPQTAACDGGGITGCIVAEVDGSAVDGSVEALIAADRNAGDTPIKLVLEGCSRSDLKLPKPK